MEIDEDGWTLRAFRQYVDMRFNESEKQVQQRFSSEERERVAALVAAEKRLDGMNEFRNALVDQTSVYMPRVEAEKLIDSLEVRLKRQEAQVDQYAGRQSGNSQTWAFIVAGISVFIALATLATRFIVT